MKTKEEYKQFFKELGTLCNKHKIGIMGGDKITNGIRELLAFEIKNEQNYIKIPCKIKGK